MRTVFSKKLFLHGTSRRYCGFLGIERAKVNRFIVMLKSSSPSPGGRIKVDSLFVSRTLYIDLILRPCSKPKIRPAIVRSIPVDMIYVNPFRGKFSSHVKPCEAMGSIISTIDPYEDLFVTSNASNVRVNTYASTGISPSKDACYGVIINDISQSIGCNHIFVYSEGRR